MDAIASKNFANKDIADEIQRFSGKSYDPSYISNVKNGSRRNESLSKLIARAVENLGKPLARRPKPDWNRDWTAQ